MTLQQAADVLKTSQDDSSQDTQEAFALLGSEYGYETLEDAKADAVAGLIVEEPTVDAIALVAEVAPIVAEVAKDAAYFGFSSKQSEKYDRETEELAAIGGKLYSGDFQSHVKFGKLAYDHVITAKVSLDAQAEKRGNGSKFKDTDHDFLCHDIAMRAERSLAIGREGKTAKVVRVIDDIRAYKWTEYAAPILGDKIKSLPWAVVNNYLVPKTLSYSKSEMGGKIKVQWIEFLRTWVGNFQNFGAEGTEFAGQSDFRRALSSAVKDHESALKEDKEVKKTEEQRALEALAKKSQETNKIKMGANKALATALSNALAGPLTPQEVADIITVTTKGMNVELPLTTIGASVQDIGGIIKMLGAVATSSDAGLLVDSLFASHKYDVLKKLGNYSSRLLSAHDEQDAPLQISKVA